MPTLALPWNLDWVRSCAKRLPIHKYPKCLLKTVRSCRCRVLCGPHLLPAVSQGLECPRGTGEAPPAEAQVLVRVLARSEELGRAGRLTGPPAQRGSAWQGWRWWIKAEPKECMSKRSPGSPPEARLCLKCLQSNWEQDKRAINIFRHWNNSSDFASVCSSPQGWWREVCGQTSAWGKGPPQYNWDRSAGRTYQCGMGWKDHGVGSLGESSGSKTGGQMCWWSGQSILCKARWHPQMNH